MEFQKYQCPVCHEQFKDGDDVVVCPECGAPHHRACYEQENRCFYEDSHGKDFSFEELNAPAEDEEQIFHDAPADEQEAEQEQSGADFDGAQGIPFGNMPFNILDPLAGMKPEEEIAEGIKVSEAAKYVGKNTPYFLIVFKRLFDAHRSRFNFSAFLFTGVYFLYRKMYKIGILVTLLNIALILGATAIEMTPYYQECNTAVMNLLFNPGAYPADAAGSLELMRQLSFYAVPALLRDVQLIIMALSGIFANRLYYKHSCGKIREIKEQTQGEETGKRFEAAGGVNFGLAMSLGVAYYIINLMCYYFTMIS